jgi:acylphosphatase
VPELNVWDLRAARQLIPTSRAATLRQTVLVSKRVHVFVSGQVQGVFFRAEAAQRARALGLSGFVRNTPDGRVEAAFEGDPEAVDAMVDWMHAGPPLARVDDVEVIEEVPRGDADFHISH